MNELLDLCRQAYNRGYGEGFEDACQRLKDMAEKLSESTIEAMSRGEE